MNLVVPLLVFSMRVGFIKIGEIFRLNGRWLLFFEESKMRILLNIYFAFSYFAKRVVFYIDSRILYSDLRNLMPGVGATLEEPKVRFFFLASSQV